MSKTLNHMIEIVHDPDKRKLRARSVKDGRWCRFPNKLRIENKIYLAENMKPGRGDSWIASGEIEEFIINKKKNIVLEEMINIKNKQLLTTFYKVLYNQKTKKVNTEMLNIIFLIKKIYPNIDEQLLSPLIKKYEHSAFIKEDLLLPMQNCFCQYNEKRVISLLSNYKEIDFLEDTVIMYQRLLENDLTIDSILPKKPKQINELHTIFTRECSKIKEPKNLLKQKWEKLIINESLTNELDFFVPITSHDLIDIGNQLSICVGNGWYAQKVVKKQASIIAIKDKKGRFKYCIELGSTDNIIQARGWANRSMDRPLRDKLLKKIQLFKNNTKKVA